MFADISDIRYVLIAIPQIYIYCGIIFICGDQCLWTAKICLVHGDVILWVRVMREIHKKWSSKNKDNLRVYGSDLAFRNTPKSIINED